MKRVQVEPHLSVTGACSAEWVPIRPKTDAAFLFALIHVLLHEAPRDRLDLPFLRKRTASPYLVGPNGYYLRDPATQQAAALGPQPRARRCLRHARASTRRSKAASRSTRSRSAPTTQCSPRAGSPARPRSRTLVEHMQPTRRNGRRRICDVPAATHPPHRQRISRARQVGATIEIEGMTLPLRPVGRHARQDRQQRLGRLRVLLGAHPARRAGRRAGGAGRHARHHGAAQPSLSHAGCRA